MSDIGEMYQDLFKVCLIVCGAGVLAHYFSMPSIKETANTSVTPDVGAKKYPIQATPALPIGVITNLGSTEIVSPVEGRLTSGELELGTVVYEGTVLARVENAETSYELQKTDANLKEADAAERLAAVELREKELSLERLTRIKASLSSNEIDIARFAVDRARAELDIAVARVKRARAARYAAADRTKRAKIVSPIAGRIAAIHRKPGAYVQVGAPLYRIDTDYMFGCRFGISATDIADLEPGDEVTVSLETDTERHAPYKAQVVGIAPELDSASGLHFVESRLLEPSVSHIRPGARVRVNLRP